MQDSKNGFDDYKEDCKLCDLVRSPRDPYFIKELTYGILRLNPNQRYRGRCTYIFKAHIDDLSKLDSKLFGDASEELLYVMKTVKKCFKPDLVNFAMLRNWERHLHWHIIPRYEGDENWGNPPWPSEPLELKEEEYRDLVNSLRVMLK